MDRIFLLAMKHGLSTRHEEREEHGGLDALLTARLQSPKGTLVHSPDGGSWRLCRLEGVDEVNAAIGNVGDDDLVAFVIIGPSPLLPGDLDGNALYTALQRLHDLVVRGTDSHRLVGKRCVEPCSLLKAIGFDHGFPLFRNIYSLHTPGGGI